MKIWILKILNKFGFPFKQDISFKKTINKKTFYFYINNHVTNHYLFDDKEPWMNQLFTRISLSQDKSILDIGANTGQTLIKVKSLFPTNPYIGFEPNPICFDYLNKIIAINHLYNTSTYNFGLSNYNGTAKLSLFNNEWDTEATLISDFRKQKIMNQIKVKLVVGDDFVKEHEIYNIGIVKIDIEGAELETIMGLSKTINYQRPIIICEILPAYSLENSLRVKRQNLIVDLLLDLKYDIYRIGKDKKQNLVNFVHLNKIEIHDDIMCSDYIFLPREKEFNIII